MPPRTPLAVDAAIAALITEGGGIATARALREGGIGRDTLRRRLGAGALTELFPTVFTLQPDQLDETVLRRAAVLSCGTGAALDLWTGAEQLRLVTFQERPDDRLHVVVPANRRPRREGTRIAVARSELLLPEDVAEHHGVACLRLSPLLLRLAADHPVRLIERFIDEAAYRGLWKPWEMSEFLAGAAGRPGYPELCATVERHTPGTTRTENELEEAFLAICDAQGWPRPICQQPDRLSDGRRIRHDFLWPRLRFSVETDGRRGHAGPRRQARDRSRDALLAARGHEAVRVTRVEVLRRPGVVVDRVGPRLERAMAKAGGRQLAPDAS